MTNPIPAFYRIWFTIVDPLFSLIGIYSNIFTPTTILNSYSAHFISPPGSETILLLDIMSAFLAGPTFLHVFLLRAKPNDMTASTLLVDIGMLAGFTRALMSQGRMDVRVWRAEEWVNYGVTAGVAVIRSTFLMGVGLGGEEVEEKKKV
ncbi:MAG: hypothetical protein Q9168_007763 [Polycauliona sp. 1 TL-2023]